MKQVFLAFMAIAMLASCNVNYDKAKSGLIYKIFPGDGKDTAFAKPGEFAKFHISYVLSEALKAGRTDIIDAVLDYAHNTNNPKYKIKPDDVNYIL